MQTPFEEILQHYPEIQGVHPACEAVPPISDEDYEALAKSIREEGLAQDIVLTKDNQLLDGRNRIRACFEQRVEARFKKTGVDPWVYSYSLNIARRHLDTKQKALYGLAWKEHEQAEAKKRQAEQAKRNQPQSQKPETLPALDKGDTRDKIGERVGVSGKSIDKVAVVAEYAPEKLHDDSSLEDAYREANRRKREKQSTPAEKPLPVVASQEMTTIITSNGVKSQIPLPKKVVFNRTNDSVDWASWTWNPISGCLHGCRFCYAREIANSERMRAYYPNKFEPTFHEYRLVAPANTSVPSSEDPRDGRVFVCSMADLFGKWVPSEWIEKVFSACLENPEWEYLFLTKWPARYAQMPLLEKAWYGSSVVQQSDVKRVEKAMKNFETDCVKWISLEPMLEPIEFDDLSWCDLVVIGAQTSTNQPEGFVPAFSPEFDWIVDVVNQCRDAGVPYYLKANLVREAPGMNLPQGKPRKKQ